MTDDFAKFENCVIEDPLDDIKVTDPRTNPQYSIEYMRYMLWRVNEKVDGLPTCAHMDAYRRISPKPYRTVCGSWRRALEQFNVVEIERRRGNI